MPPEISGSDKRSIHVAAEEALQIREPYRTFCVCGDVVRTLIDENLPSNLEGVCTTQDRDAIGDLVNTVGTDGLGPAQPNLK